MQVTQTSMWIAVMVILLSFGKDDGATVALLLAAITLVIGLWKRHKAEHVLQEHMKAMIVRDPQREAERLKRMGSEYRAQ